jgi:WD40 repeat protein
VGCEAAEARERLFWGVGHERSKPGAVPYPEAEGETNGPRFPGCPYPGLDCFQVEEAPFFFGRKQNSKEAIRRLSQSRWLQVEGASGVGKSSFTRAGIVPELLTKGLADIEGQWLVALFRPGDRPLRNLASALQTAFANVPDQPTVDSMLQILETTPERANGLSILLRQTIPETYNLAIVVDQFEELLTLAGDKRTLNQIDALFSDLLGDTAIRVRLISTIRSDFIGRFLEFEQLQRWLNLAARYYLEPLGRSQLTEAVREPALFVGLRWSDNALPDLIVDDALRAEAATQQTTQSQGPAGAVLPLVAYVLRALWEKQNERADGRLRLEDYNALGGVGGALRHGASKMIAALDPSDRERARRMLLRLVHVDRDSPGVRVPCTRKEVLSAAGGDTEAEEVLLRLSGSLRPSEREGRVRESLLPVRLISVYDDNRLDLVHEELLRLWPQMREWIEEDRKVLERRQAIENAATQWESLGRSPDWLPAGALLAWYEGQDLPQIQLERLSASQAPLEKEFLARASKKQADELEAAKKLQQDKLRRNRQIAVVFAALGLIATIAAGLAWRSRTLAIKERNEAIRSEALTNVERSANALANSDFDKALQLAVAAAPVDASDQSSLIAPEAVSAISSAIATYPLLFALRSPFGPIRSYEVRGSRIFMMHDSGLIDIFDANTAEYRGTFRTSSTPLKPLAVSDDGSHVLAMGKRQKGETLEYFWQLSSTVPSRVLRESPVSGSVASFFIKDGSARILSEEKGNGNIHVVDGNQGNELFQLTGHGEPVANLNFSPDSQTIVTATACVVRIWDATTGRRRAVIGNPGCETGFEEPHYFPIHFSISSDSSTLAMAKEGSSTVEIRDLQTGSLRSTHKVNGVIASISLSPGNSHLLVTKGNGASGISPDGSAEVFDLRAPDEPAQSVSAGTHMDSAVFSPDDVNVLTIKADGLQMTPVESIGNSDDANDKSPAFSIRGLGAVLKATFTPKGDRIMTLTTDGVVRVWRVSDAMPGHKHSGKAWFATYDPSGKYVASGGDDKLVTIWSSQDGHTLSTLTGHTGIILSAMFDRSGSRLVTASADGSVRIWNHNGQPIQTLLGHQKQVNMAAFDLGGDHVVSVSHDGTARLWDLKTGFAVVMAGHTAPVWFAAFQPGGDLIATASEDKSVILWRSGIAEAKLMHDGAVISARFSQDGSKLVTACTDSSVVVWDVHSRKKLNVLRGAGEQFLSAALDPSGNVVAAADEAQSVKFWPLQASGSVVWKGFTDKVRWVSFSPDGSRVVAASYGGQVKQFKTPLFGVDLVYYARALSTRSTSRELGSAQPTRVSESSKCIDVAKPYYDVRFASGQSESNQSIVTELCKKELNKSPNDHVLQYIVSRLDSPDRERLSEADGSEVTGWYEADPSAGGGSEGEESSSEKLLIEAADGGNAPAQRYLARSLLLKGNEPQSAAYFQKAAQAGTAEAYTDLGWLSLYGLGKAQDSSEAQRLFQLAIAKGDGAGHTGLGWMKEFGIGTASNVDEAFVEYDRAIELIGKEGGDASLAIERRAIIATFMSPAHVSQLMSEH